MSRLSREASTTHVLRAISGEMALQSAHRAETRSMSCIIGVVVFFGGLILRFVVLGLAP
uniref:Uncharacterized protein n=1 Tax=Moniliophthora roreri TaxID=221103 RepID=A0A0W0FS78_MONRR